MSKRLRPISFRDQMRQSLADLRSIMSRGESPSGNGRFTARTVEVAEPSRYDAPAVRRTRRALNASQAVFAQVLGVSPALVRAWEAGTRVPSPLARRLLDQVKAEPVQFAALVRIAPARGKATHRRVA
jgi:DNA-binding transcriptional regulator YiaG